MLLIRILYGWPLKIMSKSVTLFTMMKYMTCSIITREPILIIFVTCDFRICVHHVCDEERHEPQLTFDTDGRVTCMKYLNGLLYAGMEDGRLAIYRRDQG